MRMFRLVIFQFILSATLSLNPINIFSTIKCRSPSYLNFFRDSVASGYLYASTSFNDSPEARIQYQKDLVMSATNRKISSYSRVYTTRKVSNIDMTTSSEGNAQIDHKNVTIAGEAIKTIKELKVQPFQRLVYKDPESIENIKKFILEIEQLGSTTPGYNIRDASGNELDSSFSSATKLNSSDTVEGINSVTSAVDNNNNNITFKSKVINYNKNTNVRLAKLEKKSWKQSCRYYHHISLSQGLPPS